MNALGNPVCAVLVSFHPQPQIIRNVELLGEQVGHVVVVDNTPTSSSSNVLADLERLPQCTVIRNGSNVGIADALNTGIHRAISMGCEWIFTFDQDSQIPEGYVEKMLCAHQEASRHSNLGMVFPVYRDERLGHTYAMPRSAKGGVLAGMTSGALLHQNTFTRVGPMESQFVIDQVDNEYCLRMRSLGLTLIDCPDAILLHSLGRIAFRSLWGRGFTITNHNARRRYYITRNRLVLMKRYLGKDPEWVRFDLNRLPIDTLGILLFEHDRFLKVVYMARAVFDAAFGRLGQRVPL